MHSYISCIIIPAKTCITLCSSKLQDITDSAYYLASAGTLFNWFDHNVPYKFTIFLGYWRVKFELISNFIFFQKLVFNKLKYPICKDPTCERVINLYEKMNTWPFYGYFMIPPNPHTWTPCGHPLGPGADTLPVCVECLRKLPSDWTPCLACQMPLCRLVRTKLPKLP